MIMSDEKYFEESTTFGLTEGRVGAILAPGDNEVSVYLGDGEGHGEVHGIRLKDALFFATEIFTLRGKRCEELRSEILDLGGGEL